MFSCVVVHVPCNIPLLFCNTVYTVRCASQGNFTKSRKLLSFKKMVHGAFCLHRLVNLSLFHPVQKFFRLNINDLHLIRMVKYTVRNPFPDLYMSNRSHQIIQAFQMLNVNGGINVNPCPQKLLYVLIPLLISAAGSIGVSQFIYKNQLRFPLQSTVKIKLPELYSFIFCHKRRNGF